MLKKILVFLLLSSFCFASDLDTKIGQMIIIGFEPRDFKKVQTQLKEGQIGGVILFSKNIKSKKDLIKQNEKLLSSSKILPFIAIDNEGGEIQRYNFALHPSAKEVSAMTKEQARFNYSKMADLERELKFNFNFAPCVDLELNPASIIAKKKRSYGDDYRVVSEYSRIFVEEHNKKQIATSIKHFPGHGSPRGDTHKGFVDSTETFLKDEIMPYYELKDLDKLNTVMVSHIFNSKFDSIYPASLSKKTIDILKNQIGFKGLIVSDDYDMGAIRNNYSLRQIVVNSINAGVDILLFSNNIKTKDNNLPIKIREIVKEEIKEGNISADRIDESYKKILELKRLL